MPNFSISSDETLKAIASVSKAAKAANLSADKLANAADSSFAYQDGDKLTIPAQVASIISLTGTMKETAEANGWATAFFSFQAYVTRGGRKLPCRVSAKQLFTPTVWRDADAVEGATVPGHDDESLYTAAFRSGEKRFGEQGSLTLVQGIPVIESDINVELALETVYTPVMVKDHPKGQTALRQREDYAIAK